MNYIHNYKTIIKNTGYLSIIEGIRLLTPFIALPYIIRTIGAEKYGIVVFVQAIMQYFIILINFGLNISAVKDVAFSRNNPQRLNQIVSAVFQIKLLLFLIATILLIVGILLIPFWQENRSIFYFSFLLCLSEVLFPAWFFQGIEKMKYITFIRTSSILFYVVTVFIFIRSVNDYKLVPLLQSLGSVLAAFIACYLMVSKEKIVFVRLEWEELRKIFRESLPFFISRVSNVLNLNMAKTVSGIFFTMEGVAAFDLAQRIAQFSLIPIQMLNQAVYPHIARTLNRNFVTRFFYIDVVLAFLVAGSIYLLAPICISYFAGDSMPEAINLLRLLTLFIFCGYITTYIGTPVLVSFGHPKIFNLSVILSTIALLLFYVILYIGNWFTLQKFALTLFGAEATILFYRLYYCYHFNIFLWNKRN